MDPRTNPYNPGAGLRPVALAGRDADIEAFEVLAARAERGLVSRSIVFSGLRGVGKTVLLGELAGRALDHRWLVIQLEAEHTRPDHFSAAFAAELANAARRQRRWLSRASEKVKVALGSITSFQAAVGAEGISLGFERIPGRADSGKIQFDLVDLAEAVGAAAKDDHIGVVIIIDEMQELTVDQMSAVCRSCHRAGQLSLPWFVIGGGLPNLSTRLAEAESYAERLFDYRAIEPLSDTDALFALTQPAAAQHVTWKRDAARFVLDESGGYPYFLQQFGKTVWDVAAGPHTIALDDATIGVAEGQQQLDIGFYSSRWERATKAERAFLRAMSADGGMPSKISDITERLGKTSSRSLGPARASLIGKGIVYAPEHGIIAYTVPGMADYVRRRDDDPI
ncbi:MAG: ATP-binding protein [Actinobacteria bacterium]|nr:ATP-binding protein [Actinomycetota bacterium]